MNKTYTVYYHTFPNGKMYFGQTCQKPENRWGNDGSGYKGQPIMWNAIQKYGWENIEHRVISIGLDKDEADFQEMFYISAYRTNEIEFGYNQTKGGEGTSGVTTNEELRRARSERFKQNNPMKNAYSKNKLSESRKGIKLSDETKKKLSEVHKGRVMSEETKKKISEANKGKSRHYKRSSAVKYEWLTPDGNVVEMRKSTVIRFHKDWKLLN